MAAKSYDFEPLTSKQIEEAANVLSFAKQELTSAGFDRLADNADRYIIQLSIQNSSSALSIAANLRELRIEIEKELSTRKFILVQPDRTEYACNERLFGDTVYERFTHARSDIKEAGNCLAIEDGTGAVFHLMRVAEHGLRALAHDRDIKVKIPIELADWGAVIKQLETAENAIEQYPKTLGREAQYNFYHDAMMNLRAFKNIFRNPVMHTRSEFDRHEAMSVMQHVKAFMQTLSTRLGDGIRTAEKWGDDMADSAKLAKSAER